MSLHNPADGVGVSPVHGRELLRSELLWLALMLAAIAVVYWPPTIGEDQKQLAMDFDGLHVRRMMFARESLLGSAHELPGWYTAEALGTPFWSNIQNFPFLPTRLALLLLNPRAPYTYGIAVLCAAMLAAFFTFRFSRSLRFAPLAAAAAGWTFAASGFFASRIAAGHLPLLETYFALPALLWAIEMLAQTQETGGRLSRRMVALAILSTCIVLGGHPQLPTYALMVSGLYAVWRFGPKRVWLPASAMALGIGMAAFSLVPLFQLIGRSTRILGLAQAENDLSLPYGRLAALFFPWIDGAVSPLSRAAETPFAGANKAIFWDTNGYVGWVPWMALGVILWLVIRRDTRLKNQAAKSVLLLGAVGLLALAFSLPWFRSLTSLMPGTLLRSPSRLLYVSGFALSMGLGFAAHELPGMLATSAHRFRHVVLVVILLHCIDLGIHDREYLIAVPMRKVGELAPLGRLVDQNSSERVAVDHFLKLDGARAVDDVGFFDSIMLAKPYRTILDLAGAPKGFNVQMMYGSYLTRRALRALGVQLVVTARHRPDLAAQANADSLVGYSVPGSATRATFFPLAQVRFASVDAIHEALRDPKEDVVTTAWIPETALRPTKDLDPVSANGVDLHCLRPSNDHLECTVKNPMSGYFRLLESWDPGWSTMVDGQPMAAVAESDAWLAVPLTSGNHQVSFDYHTPGTTLGWLVSLCSMVGLLFAVWTVRFRRKSSSPGIG